SLSNHAGALLETSLSEDNVWLIRLRQRVGRALYRLGRFEESEAVFQRALEDCERTLGPSAPDTLAACAKLASPLVVLGRRPDGISLFRRAAEGYLRTLGATHPRTLNARSNLLEVSTQPADVDAGPGLVIECRREVGEEHTITLGAELNCAFALNRAGRPAEALPHIRSAFAKFSHRYGADYPITLNSRQTLGVILHALGEKDEAIEHMEMVAQGRTRALGPNHPWTIHARELLDTFRES
ncbi:tetratricopeptide repeat protein, partial [Streptomyces sp. NPDC007162]|uniref:tetratricopeptide repeat protein n=1 Tax=Streptomyces sp. NPDC007162 TaxID=3156917 RepID=UPI0033C049AC